MYYEEKLIDGILHCRVTPDGEWRYVSARDMTNKILELETENKNLLAREMQAQGRYNETAKALRSTEETKRQLWREVVELKRKLDALAYDALEEKP